MLSGSNRQLIVYPKRSGLCYADDAGERKEMRSLASLRRGERAAETRRRKAGKGTERKERSEEWKTQMLIRLI